ncbi:hypothetical protein B0T16DRAFT_423919 [Cercophora newfieldiana]|uniref:Uncharacterized protein n=1 Tax=Cercophora newfieldiana TaxID=92897 RepID=A0AA40CIQ3_9PEZI|nr:hypothetical protein B0T16DRAFT_423919 [Cercophora newfieldiana]
MTIKHTQPSFPCLQNPIRTLPNYSVIIVTSSPFALVYCPVIAFSSIAQQDVYGMVLTQYPVTSVQCSVVQRSQPGMQHQLLSRAARTGCAALSMPEEGAARAPRMVSMAQRALVGNCRSEFIL